MRLAVVVEVDEKSELDRETRIDDRFGPRPAAFPWILPPRDFSRKPGHADDVGVPVAVDIERQIAEPVDVILRVVQFAELVLDPRGRFVPVLAGDNIQSAVAIDVGDRCRLTRAGIEEMDSERDVWRSR